MTRRLAGSPATARNSAALAVAALVLLVAPGAARAAGSPAITLAQSAPAEALSGTSPTITLTAANPSGQPTGFSLSFRVVLPEGVRYAGHAESGSIALTPEVIENAPSAGETTLIWSNTGDLPANSRATLTFQVASCASSSEPGCAAKTYPIG